MVRAMHAALLDVLQALGYASVHYRLRREGDLAPFHPRLQEIADGGPMNPSLTLCGITTWNLFLTDTSGIAVVQLNCSTQYNKCRLRDNLRVFNLDEIIRRNFIYLFVP